MEEPYTKSDSSFGVIQSIKALYHRRSSVWILLYLLKIV